MPPSDQSYEGWADRPRRYRGNVSSRLLIVDGHNDLPHAMRKVGYDFTGTDIATPQPQLHSDLPRLRQGQVGAQFWSVYVPCSLVGAAAVTATLEQIDAVYTMVARYADDLVLVTSATGLDAVLAEGGPSAACSGPRVGTRSTTRSACCARTTGWACAISR